MARKPRLHIAGGLNHVVLRGKGGQGIFLDNEDRVQVETLVAEGIKAGLGTGFMSITGCKIIRERLNEDVDLYQEASDLEKGATALSM